MCRVPRDRAHVVERDVLPDIEPEVGQLQGDVGGEPFRRDAIEDLRTDGTSTSKDVAGSIEGVIANLRAWEKANADVLAKTVEKLGGKPAQAQPSYDFPVAQLKSQADVLRFAAKLEQGAVSAYLGAVPLFDNRELSKAAASILGDEAMHWAVLRQALGEVPVPSAFVS